MTFAMIMYTRIIVLFLVLCCYVVYVDAKEDEVVGLGLYQTPLTNLLVANARAKSALNQAVLNSHAMALRAQTNLRKSLMDGKMRHLVHPRPMLIPPMLLGATKEERFHSPNNNWRKNPLRKREINEEEEEAARHDKHRLNDEQLFVWSLNNMARDEERNRAAHFHSHFTHQHSFRPLIHSHSHSFETLQPQQQQHLQPSWNSFHGDSNSKQHPSWNGLHGDSNSKQHPSWNGLHGDSNSKQHPSWNGLHGDSNSKQQPSWNAPHGNINKPPISAGITINNQHNSFGLGQGTQNVQISQVNGHGLSQQTQVSDKQPPNHFSHSDFVGAPFLLEFPRNYESMRRHARALVSRRSLPLARLAIDPNAKLDMTRTLDNIGAIAKNSFDDKRYPIYHMKNVVGSAKNAFLSALKIAPQDMIIPSQYRIINTKEEVVLKPEELRALREGRNYEKDANEYVVGKAQPAPPKPLSLKEKLEQFRLNLLQPSNNLIKKNDFSEVALRRAAFNPPAAEKNDDPFNFLGTFKKVGTLMRDSVKSSHETIEHLNDVAHNARKAFTTARLSAPTALLPYARAPVLKSEPSKLMFVTPRFLDVQKDDWNQPEGEKPTFLKMNELMDAFGVSNPNVNKPGFTKITFHRENALPKLQSRFGDDNPVLGNNIYVTTEDIRDDELTDVDAASWNTLQSIKEAIGAETLRDFLNDIKRDLSLMKENLQANEEQKQLVKREHKLIDDELNAFLTNMFAGGQRNDERVGMGLQLPDNLWKPFMNQPSSDQLKEYFRQNGDDFSLFDADDDARASMHFHPKLLKPFMGKT